MNERIRELAEQATDSIPDECPTVEYSLYLFQKKFAELLINDCIALCDKHDPHPDQWSDREEYAERRTVLKCVNSIKQHFGVQE